MTPERDGLSVACHSNTERSEGEESVTNGIEKSDFMKCVTDSSSPIQGSSE
jgi:hypothetical protein